MALSNRYSQYPANSRLETTATGVTGDRRLVPSADTASARTPFARSAERPSGSGLTPARDGARTKPKPVAWS